MLCAVNGPAWFMVTLFWLWLLFPYSLIPGKVTPLTNFTHACVIMSAHVYTLTHGNEIIPNNLHTCTHILCSADTRPLSERRWFRLVYISIWQHACMLMSVNTHPPHRSHCYVHTIDVLKHTCIPFMLFTSSRARADMFWHTYVHTCIHTYTNTILHSRRQVTLSTYMIIHVHEYIHTYIWTGTSCFAKTLDTLCVPIYIHRSNAHTYMDLQILFREDTSHSFFIKMTVLWWAQPHKTHTHTKNTCARAHTHTHTEAVIVFFHEDD
jgi:hypothetical protein